MSIARQTTKNAKVREDLNASYSRHISRSIKVLMDLERERNTFFYRHVGPNGPKEVYSRYAPFPNNNFFLI